MKKFLFLLVLGFGLNSCQEITEYYLGIPMQPKFEENSYYPGLNIFGVLRPDYTGAYNNSFIEIQKVMPAVNKNDSLDVDTVVVHLTNSLENLFCDFNLTDFDTVFAQSKYRPLCSINPKPGEIYSLECNYPGLPSLMAHTIIPNKPEIIENSIIRDDNSLFFEIKADSSIFMFDVFYFTDSSLVNALRLPSESGLNTGVMFNANGYSIDFVKIYSYDYNLASYYLTSNTSLNFNKYRNSYSTVENGYGVFGSINFISYKFQQ